MHYQARDMGVVRGNLGKFPVMLASATPSIESHVNAHHRSAIAMSSCRAASPASRCRTCRPSICAANSRNTGKWLAPRLGRGDD